MPKRDPNCQRCPLHQTAEHVCLLGVGPKRADIMLIGEAPGHREDDSGVPFVGRSGQLLDEMLEHTGLKREDIFITNAVSCRPPNNRPPTRREMKACRYWLDQQIAEVKPKYIGLLGNVALEQVLGVKGIKRLRGRPIERDGVTYLPMFHPSYILRGDLADQPTAEQDLRKLKDILEFGGVPEERELNFTIVDTWAKVDAMLEAMQGLVSFDLETTSLYPWAGKIVVAGVGTSTGEFILPVNHSETTWSEGEIEEIIDRMGDRIADCITVAHNGKFDQLWLYVHQQRIWHLDFDSMLAHHIIDENGRHDLENLARIYFNAPEWDIPLHDKQGAASIARLAKYAAHDVYYTRRLYHKIKPLIAQDPPIKRLFDNLVMPAANLYVEMEARGCYIDLKKMKTVEKFLRDEIDKAEQRLKKWGDINWASPKQVSALLYGKLKIKCPILTKKGAPSSAESALKMIDHPCVTDLLTFRGHNQQLSFFIEGWKPYIHEGRIHPSFKLHGTVTGRPSCQHPNFQQVPRDSLIRSLVTSPSGWALVEADLSQIELRVIAELSRDPELVRCFLNGVDVHWRTTINSLESSTHGDYHGEAVKTIKDLCLRYHLPPNERSTSLLQKLFNRKTSAFITDSLLQSCCEVGSNKKSRDREWGERPDFSSLERWLKVVAEKEFSQDLLRMVREYALSVSTSQGREQQELGQIKLGDALQTLSSIGPSISEGINEVWKEARKKAKAINFGFSFGMGHKKFLTYAKDNYGITLTERDAILSRRSFFDLYRLEGWHQSQRRYAYNHGYVRALDGRKRRLPMAQSKEDTPERAEAWRQAINSPVQGFASDLNLMVLLQLRKEFPRAAVQPIITVHDSILIEVREDHVERVIHRLEEIMRGPELFELFNINLTVPIMGETKIGAWGSGRSFAKWGESNGRQQDRGRRAQS